MGVLTDFFLATDSDVSCVLSGWQLPPPLLPQAVVVETINPFTRQPVQITTRRDPDSVPEPNPEADPSPDVSSLPNVQCKGLLPDKLALAFSALAHVSENDAMDSILCGDLVGPPNTEIVVLRMPEAFTVALASASDQDLMRAARVVMADDEMSRPEDSDALGEILREVRGLARRGLTEDASLFIRISP